MDIQTAIGLMVGILLIWLGYVTQSKGIYALISGFWISWEPVNDKKLGKRVGLLIILLGILAILTAILSIWLGVVIGKISGVLALIVGGSVFITIGIDQTGR